MKKRILVADDSITIQKVVELTFPEGEYDVVCAGNGAAARQRIEEAAPDIALLDVIMPGASGYEICAHIRGNASTAWMPVLLLAGTFEAYDERKAAEVGADGSLRKPFESRALVARVEELLAARPRPGIPAASQRPVAERAAAAAPPTPASQTVRMRVAEPSPPPQAPPARAHAMSPEPSLPGAVPRDVVEKAVREAVAGVSEKIIREVAWEVIPDLAEAIIRRRIREIEDEAESRS
ncbi:MAG TPA: response regulator [Candidatus Polarisedimenticolia bacterium]|nr:response regulator [Candidatus Polarisedimenticolia bacterium]